jgi:hypothetical protein
MTTTHEDGNDTHVVIEREEPRVALEMQAKRAEARLLATLEKVDRKRHNIEEEAERFPHQLLVGAIVVGGAVLGIVATVIAARRRKPEGPASFIARLEALHRAWTHPERVASHATAPRTSLARQAGLSAMSAAASLLVSYLAKRATAMPVAAAE